jgi:hypothetical protein
MKSLYRPPGIPRPDRPKWNACLRKRIFATMAAAEACPGRGPDQAPYKCPFGDHWHLMTVGGH